MFEVPYWGWVLLVLGGLFFIVGGICVGLASVWKAREKRDGLRG